jgi:hypothetical protein
MRATRDSCVIDIATAKEFWNYTGGVIFFRRIAAKSGAPHVPIASRLPKRNTASILSRPSRDQ